MCVCVYISSGAHKEIELVSSTRARLLEPTIEWRQISVSYSAQATRTERKMYKIGIYFYFNWMWWRSIDDRWPFAVNRANIMLFEHLVIKENILSELPVLGNLLRAHSCITFRGIYVDSLMCSKQFNHSSSVITKYVSHWQVTRRKHCINERIFYRWRDKSDRNSMV